VGQKLACPFSFIWRTIITIQHKDIPDAYLHEPKGVSSAGASTVYVANGSGSGSWSKVDSTALKALTGDGGSSNLRLISNGANGFALKTDAAYGAMTCTGNTNGYTVFAATDSTLNTPADYTLFTGTGAPLAAENLLGCTFNTNRITVPVTGLYRVSLSASIANYPGFPATLATKYRVNGTAFQARKTVVKNNASGSSGNINSVELVALNQSDYLQLYFASTVAGNAVISDLAFIIELVKAS
jgi:hypothetical protein